MQVQQSYSFRTLLIALHAFHKTWWVKGGKKQIEQDWQTVFKKTFVSLILLQQLGPQCQDATSTLRVSLACDVRLFLNWKKHKNSCMFSSASNVVSVFPLLDSGWPISLPLDSAVCFKVCNSFANHRFIAPIVLLYPLSMWKLWKELLCG